MQQSAGNKNPSIGRIAMPTSSTRRATKRSVQSVVAEKSFSLVFLLFWAEEERKPRRT